jgi:hypothetical protein
MNGIAMERRQVDELRTEDAALALGTTNVNLRLLAAADKLIRFHFR